jgi:hypothetical protein
MSFRNRGCVGLTRNMQWFLKACTSSVGDGTGASTTKAFCALGIEIEENGFILWVGRQTHAPEGTCGSPSFTFLPGC